MRRNTEWTQTAIRFRNEGAVHRLGPVLPALDPGVQTLEIDLQIPLGCLGLMPSGQRLIARKTFLLARGHRRPQFQRLVDHEESFKTRPSPSDRDVAIVEQTTS